MNEQNVEQDAGFISEILSDPNVMNQVMPLLNGLIDQRIQPVVAELQQVSQGVKLIAEGMLAQAQPPAQPQQQLPPQGYPQQPFPAQPVGPDPRQQAPQGLDRFASLAPLLMQYLTNQQQGGGTTNLSNIAETLSAASAIGNAMNRPMWDGMKMATDMFSLAGRAGIEPTTAAEHLGGMIEKQTNNGSGYTEAG